MADQITFDDGAAYERYMGVWSRSVGTAFLDWLAPPPGLKWLDVGCGNGAFTATLFDRCAPVSVDGIDRSEAQIAHARARFAGRAARFHRGDAMALPFDDDQFDAAVMPLVIFFVPAPARGVAEMARVVRSGGIVTAYGWDLEGGGFPYEAFRQEISAIGGTVPQPPNPGAADRGVLQRLWNDAGLTDIATREITVQRTFDSFDDYWAIASRGPSVGAALAEIPSADVAALQARMRDVLPADRDGRITITGRANAVRGHVRR
jgi:SAM-dependent methyltransferase